MPWETTEENIRSGHGNPDNFDPDSFRTIDITTGIKAVIGCPKGNYENGKCKVGTEVQSYLFDKAKFTMKEAKAWFKEHEGGKKEEEKMDEKISWVQEIEQAFRAMDEKSTKAIYGDYKPFLLNVDKIEASLVSFSWTASFAYSAGTMIAELLPDFGETPNQNGFFLSKKLKDSVISALNSMKIPLRDAHSKLIRDILGIVKRGYEKRGKIYIEADVEDPTVDGILKKYKDTIGCSIGGIGTGYCTTCGQKVRGMSKCPEHPKAPIEVREFSLQEISITSDPAWKTSMIKEYK